MSTPVVVQLSFSMILSILDVGSSVTFDADDLQRSKEGQSPSRKQSNKINKISPPPLPPVVGTFKLKIKCFDFDDMGSILRYEI